MVLEGKVAVLYGASGNVGRTVAKAFAREGAIVFVTGRALPKVEELARQIVAAGGQAGAAQVDATDETAIEQHLDSVVKKTGRLDISFNESGIAQQGIQGIP